VTQAVARAARRATPTYSALVAGVKASPVVAPDETGWRVGGRRAWLWAFVGQGITVYRVAAGRGFDDAAVVLGAGYAGVLERDGWAPYRKFTHAVHQTCVAHLLRRVGELLADAKRGQAKTPHAIRRILQQALAVRAARDAGRLTPAEAAAQAERLGAAVDKLVAGRSCYPPNRRLLDHLGREREALFTFLAQLGVQATNWRAEQAIRPAVVPQAVGRQRHLGRCDNLAGACQRAAHRDPAAARSGRPAGGAAARTRPGRRRPGHPRPGAGAVSPTRRTRARRCATA
jgi:transposase